MSEQVTSGGERKPSALSGRRVNERICRTVMRTCCGRGRELTCRGDVPPTSGDAQDHPDGEQDAPDARLQHHMHPENCVDGRVHLLLGESVMVFMRCRDGDRTEERGVREKASRSSRHGGGSRRKTKERRRRRWDGKMIVERNDKSPTVPTN